MVRYASLLLVLLAAAAAPRAEIYSWVDEHGVTHITDHPDAVPERARGGEGRESLRGLWESAIDPQALGRPRGESSSSDEERTLRVLRGAVADLERGENARAIAAFQSILRDDPGRPEAHWYLARVDQQRGRYQAAAVHLQAFLAAAGDEFEPLRPSAQRRLVALADEERIADTTRERGPAHWKGVAHPHFRVRYDAELAEASPDYAQTVLRYLEQARSEVGTRLGTYPAEAMGVVFYGKAAYLQAHRHRFSFQTVGFFDGRIHVVSAAHPTDELRGLLYHEYTHAVFREQTGGDRPFWLNEGLSEISERTAYGLAGMTRSERVALKGRIEEGRWIPLRQLAPSFSGLDDADARGAYLQALASALWIESHTDTEERRRLLERLGEGAPDDRGLRETVGLDTEGVDAAVRAHILTEFPPRRAGVDPSL